MSTKQARTLTRSAPAPRVNDSSPVAVDRVVPPEERDPNKIYSRDGREVTLRFTGDEDRFNLAAMGIYPPEGWTYEWKAKTVKNWEWTDNQVQLYQNGWTPVPASRHDGAIMPPGHPGNIERGGLILMERDERLTDKARDLDRRRANDPVRNSRQMAGLMAQQTPGISDDSMDFSSSEARGRSFVRSERNPVSNQGKYTYEE